MSRYSLFIAAAAEDDLDSLVNYIALDLREPATALKQLARIKEAITALEELPERHGLVRDEYLAVRGIRRMPVDNYLIFYTVNQSTKAVTIVRILQGRRNWESLL